MTAEHTTQFLILRPIETPSIPPVQLAAYLLHHDRLDHSAFCGGTLRLRLRGFG
jgi:hypothetical protein